MCSDSQTLRSASVFLTPHLEYHHCYTILSPSFECMFPVYLIYVQPCPELNRCCFRLKAKPFSARLHVRFQRIRFVSCPVLSWADAAYVWGQVHSEPTRSFWLSLAFNCTRPQLISSRKGFDSNDFWVVLITLQATIADRIPMKRNSLVHSRPHWAFSSPCWIITRYISRSSYI